MRQLGVLLLVSLLAAAPAAQAVEDQFYFVGRVVATPAGNQVYLRWDVVESQLPADVQNLRLLRNGTAVEPDWPANGVMSPARIEELYRGTEHRQRRLETVTRLNELAADQGIPFAANQFATTLNQLLDPASPDYNPLWSLLGSRTDFNIARARYRAWVDPTPTPEGDGLVKYELLAVAGSTTARLGYIEIDPTAQQQPLGATNLEQVRVSDWRCDLPESAQDHYTVMLDWLSPGVGNVADRLAAQNYIAGFDLYRTTENLDPTVTDAPARDIAALAAAADVDSRGRPVIDGLEKVNVSLIIDSGAPTTDPEWLEAKGRLEQVLPESELPLPTIPDAQIPREAKWVEARDLLMRAGLRPGDRRAYYLVPRDFTGNYGPTVGEVVVVPEMTRPPAPWNLRVFADQTSSASGGTDALTFTWDEVDIANYVKSYDGTRLFCNLVEAQTTGVLEYVALGESCETGNRNAVRLDVPAYRIYRFTDFDLAGRFKDSDGDGVSDSDETPDLDRNGLVDAFERSAGTQCNALLQPPLATDYLEWGPEPENSGANSSIELVFDRIFNPAPPNVVQMRDQVPAAAPDVVFWYRIVSQATSGRLSYMSAPQRGLFPDRNPPAEPTVFVGKPGGVPEGCEVDIDSTKKDWSFEEQLSLDGQGVAVTVSCSTNSFDVTTDRLTFGSTECDAIEAACGTQAVTISFDGNANTGGQSCAPVVQANEARFCRSGGVALVPKLVDGFVPVEPGELVPGGVKVEVTPPPPDPNDPDDRICIALYENIDGSATRVGSTCDPEPLTYFPRPGQFCGYAVATDENNNISTTVQFPCTLTPLNPKAPATPQILTFDVDNDLARFTFRLPAENVAMAMARLEFDPPTGETTRSVEAIPVIDNEPGEAVGYSIAVDPLQGTSDRFCLSMLSVGRDNGAGQSRNSDWSTEKCFTRTAEGEDLPQYMPWPEVQGAVEGEPLVAARVTDFRSVPEFLAIRIADSSEFVDVPLQNTLNECYMLFPGQNSTSDPPPANEAELTEFDSYNCLGLGLARFRSIANPELDFIVYRQSRVNGGAASDWIQVSPFINYIHFDRQVFEIGDRNITLWTLNDPYFKLIGSGLNTVSLLFIDQYPFIASADLAGTQPYEWRYQLVYFDSQRRPVKWRASDWFRGDD